MASPSPLPLLSLENLENRLNIKSGFNPSMPEFDILKYSFESSILIFPAIDVCRIALIKRLFINTSVKEIFPLHFTFSRISVERVIFF